MASDVPFGGGGRGGGRQGNGAAVGFGYGRHRIGSYATLARFELTSAKHCKRYEVHNVLFVCFSFTSVPMGGAVPVSYSSSRRRQRVPDTAADSRRVVGGAVVSKAHYPLVRGAVISQYRIRRKQI